MQTKNQAQMIASAVVGLLGSLLAVGGLSLDPELEASMVVIAASVIGLVIGYVVPERNPAPSAVEVIRSQQSPM